MLKRYLLFIIFCWFLNGFSQEKQQKTIAFSQDTIALDLFKTNYKNIQFLDYQNNIIDSSYYYIDKKKNKIIFSKNFPKTDSIKIREQKLPKFLTKTYSQFDENKVIPNQVGNLYALEIQKQNPFKPFDGLNTSGSITRGIAIGNNQNTSVNSNLDLQISGKLSDKLGLRASIQDSNIPIQNDGYSQKLDAFDQIFIELFAKNWNIKAGDLFLENRKSKFLNFNKKVQGLLTQINFGSDENKTQIVASGAVVRGQYAKSTFVGQEGNQGPYKLKGNNDELYVLVISGSERVYVNGILLNRGENNDYTIDYNAGEIKFNAVFAINSEMRIAVEYQYSERNFTRFITYAGAEHQNKKWNFGGYIYSESDVKNQPLQQSLSQNQVAILQNAGDDNLLMNAPSADEESYSENKILYKKIIIGAENVFEYSTNQTDVLYNVKFSFVGANFGHYKLINSNAIGKIYQYIAPILGVLQGSYEPTIRLYAPTKLQLATVYTKYNPSEKTTIEAEIAASNNDLNLYSVQDDTNNKGFATKINIKQQIASQKNKLDVFADVQIIEQNFKSVERIFAIEFNRDWNITTILGNQSLITAGFHIYDDKKYSATYTVERLGFSQSFLGTKHSLQAFYKTKTTTLETKNSVLKSDATQNFGSFIRSQSRAKYHFGKNYTGTGFRLEDNKLKDKNTNLYTVQSQRFSEISTFIGRGDSTKVYAELGYLKRWNDSLQNGFLKPVNRSQSYYLKSKIIQTTKANLAVFINYRQLKFENNQQKNENSLNSRLLYNDSFFSQFLQTSTSFETLSGTLPQQEFTYLQVNAGQGVYMWNDYNNNGTQELQEFEIAPYPDLAKYIRVFLPNQIFIKTHQNKFSQSLTINPSRWMNKEKSKKFLSKFFNQTAFSIDRKIQRLDDNFDLNPFINNSNNLLGINSNFRNSLYYNRGKQKHAITYNYLQNSIKTLLNIGSQENKTATHQLQYVHLVKKMWLANCNANLSKSQSQSNNYATRNYELKTYSFEPKLSYLFSSSITLSMSYEYKGKANEINSFEKLKQQKAAIQFNYLSEKNLTFNASYALYNNNFVGNSLSPVAFTMLEGLQPGKNSTWNLLLQKKLTQFLDININYLGRKSNAIKTIHTGSVQLRAYF